MPTRGLLGLAALLARCRAGEAPAWEGLFAWAGPIGLRELSRYGRSRKQEHEEMLGTFDEKLFRAVRDNRINGATDGEIAAYVIQIARRLVIDAHRGRQGNHEQLPEDFPVEGPLPDEKAEDKQRRQRLEAELDTWPPKDRYLLLAKAEGVPAAVIAEHLKKRYGEIVALATVDSRYSKLRKRLRESRRS